MKKIVFALCLLTASLGMLSAQDAGNTQLYSLGNNAFSLSLFGDLPLFYQDHTGAIVDTNLSLGGGGTIRWDSYLNNNWTLGAEAGVQFNFSPNDNTWFAVPVLFDLGYEIQAMPFSIPLSLGLGFTFMSYLDSFTFTPIVKPSAGFFWHFDASWSFGTRLSYLWIPEIHADDPDTVNFDETVYTMFGNFLELSLSATYHF